VNYLEAALSGILMGLIIALSVGPTLFAILKYCFQYGYRAGIAFVLGVSVSDLLYVLLANLATEWMSFLNLYKKEIGTIGAVIFILVGLISFFKKTIPKRSMFKGNSSITNGIFLKLWLGGFVVNALNPGVILTWIFSVVKTIPYNSVQKTLFYGSCLIMVLLLDFMKVFFANKIRLWLSLRKVLLVNKLSAILIFIFGVGLLLNALLG
jgi:threonine/homoserine/homoserine lactone efflux protein